MSRAKIPTVRSFRCQACRGGDLCPSRVDRRFRVGPIFGVPMCHTMGIDAGSRTGIAIWDERTRRLEWLCTVDESDALEQIKELLATYHVERIVIEYPSGTTYRRKKTSDRAWRKIAQNVGENRKTAEWLSQFCAMMCDDVELVAPLKGGTKMDAASFARAFDWEARCSHHARDAAMLARAYAVGVRRARSRRADGR